MKVKALLCLLGREPEIDRWVKSRVSDDRLPFRLELGQNEEGQLLDQNGLPLECVTKWRFFEKKFSNQNQFALLTPRFQLDAQGKPVNLQLHDKTILPWCKSSPGETLSWEVSHKEHGGYGVVQGVVMPRSSHNFMPLLEKVCKDFNCLSYSQGNGITVCS